MTCSYQRIEWHCVCVRGRQARLVWRESYDAATVAGGFRRTFGANGPSVDRQWLPPLVSVDPQLSKYPDTVQSARARICAVWCLSTPPLLRATSSCLHLSGGRNGCSAREPGTPRPRPIHGSKAEISGFLLVPPVPSGHNCVRNAVVVKVSVLTVRFLR